MSKAAIKYFENCYSMLTTLKIKFSEDDFFFFIDKNTSLFSIVINEKSKITITKSATFDDIYKYAKKLLDEKEKLCMICVNKIESRIICESCLKNYCLDCYIKIYKIGSGIITCPCCALSNGKLLNKKELEHAIKTIRKNQSMSYEEYMKSYS